MSLPLLDDQSVKTEINIHTVTLTECASKSTTQHITRVIECAVYNIYFQYTNERLYP